LMNVTLNLACLFLFFSLVFSGTAKAPVLNGSTPTYSTLLQVNFQPFTVAAFQVNYTSPITSAFLSYGQAGVKVSVCSILAQNGQAIISCPKGAVLSTIGPQTVLINVVSSGATLLINLSTLVVQSCNIPTNTINIATDKTSVAGLPFHMNITGPTSSYFGSVQVHWGIGQATSIYTNVSSPLQISYNYLAASAWQVSVFVCPENAVTLTGQCDNTCAYYTSFPVTTVYGQPVITSSPTSLSSSLVVNSTYPAATFTLYTHLPLIQSYVNFGDSNTLNCVITNGNAVLIRSVSCPQHVYQKIGNYNVQYYFSDNVFPSTTANYTVSITA